MPAWPARARSESPDMPRRSAAVADSEGGAGGPRRQAAAVVPSQEGHWRCEGPSGL